jgi:hypothetical protein
MKKLLTIYVAFVLMLQAAVAVGVGGNLGVIITPEQFAPRVFMDPNSRIVLDDPTEPGAMTGDGEIMYERINNYAFEGESISWDVMVWDKNGVPEKLSDVYVKVAPTVCGGITQACDSVNYIEANCAASQRQGLCLGKHGYSAAVEIDGCDKVWYEGEEDLQWNAETMGWYTCTLTVETPVTMHGEYALSAVAVDLDGLSGQFFEQELWFFNPEIALGFDGSLNFGTVRPGGVYKSSTLTIENQAEFGSGVLLDMFVAGTDFYDPAHAGTMCPTSNVLKLENFRYYASQGAYNTCLNAGTDAECYDTINYYMDGAGAPGNNNYGRIIDGPSVGPYPLGNIMTPGSELSMNFKLALPEPCNGASFTQGKFMFFGEAI